MSDVLGKLNLNDGPKDIVNDAAFAAVPSASLIFTVGEDDKNCSIDVEGVATLTVLAMAGAGELHLDLRHTAPDGTVTLLGAPAAKGLTLAATQGLAATNVPVALRHILELDEGAHKLELVAKVSEAGTTVRLHAADAEWHLKLNVKRLQVMRDYFQSYTGSK